MAARLGTTENNNTQVSIYLHVYIYIMQGTALNKIKIRVLFFARVGNNQERDKYM